MPIKVMGNSDIDTATAEIAVALRDADPGRRDQEYYDMAVRLRDDIMRGTRWLDAYKNASIKGGWLHERVNDPYGTPNKHPFWETVQFGVYGDFKVFDRDDVAYAYDFKHNAWLHFSSMTEAMDHVRKPAIDPWA
jgi:hypothetical protein